MRDMRKRTGARIVPLFQCAYQHDPSDKPGEPYRKLTWWLVSPGLWLYALLIARTCNNTKCLPKVGPSYFKPPKSLWGKALDTTSCSCPYPIITPYYYFKTLPLVDTRLTAESTHNRTYP